MDLQYSINEQILNKNYSFSQLFDFRYSSPLYPQITYEKTHENWLFLVYLLDANLMKCENIQAQSQIIRQALYSFIKSIIVQTNQQQSMNEPLPNPFLKIKDQPTPDILDTECPSCHQSATTTILITSIPLFREIMICSFACQHCGSTNNQVQFAGRLPDFGVSMHFRCLSTEDLNRQIIKSQHCTLQLLQLELTLPPSKRAEITTIESILQRSYDDISSTLKTKSQGDEEYTKLNQFLQKLLQYSQGKHFPLTLTVRDPSGNSNIKNPFAPKLDKNMQINYFKRTVEELIAMGYNPTNAEIEVKHEEEKQLCGDKLNFVKPFEEKDFLKYEPVSFEVQCEVCFKTGKMVTCRTSVPYFTDFIIMSFSCDYCGYHSTETKNSSGIGKQALVITLNVEDETDLKRDLFKSQTCFVEIPQIELELDYGTLGGVLTTVQGLLEKIYDHLNDHNPFADSDKEFGQKMAAFLGSLQEMRKGKRKFTLRLIDPIAQSFLQNPYAPEEDRNAIKFLRERTYEENDMLGFNDMKVENYH